MVIKLWFHGERVHEMKDRHRCREIRSVPQMSTSAPNLEGLGISSFLFLEFLCFLLPKLLRLLVPSGGQLLLQPALMGRAFDLQSI